MSGKWRAMFAIAMAGVMQLLDVSAVNIALPDIQRDLGASFNELRWVISTRVLFDKDSVSRFLKAASEELSIQLVGSSSIRIGGSSKSALAMVIAWRWPPDRLMPRSPTCRSRPCGWERRKSLTPVTWAARNTAWSSKWGAPKAMLSRTVPKNR